MPKIVFPSTLRPGNNFGNDIAINGEAKTAQ
jgi:hypothetical protein